VACDGSGITMGSLSALTRFAHFWPGGGFGGGDCGRHGVADCGVPRRRPGIAPLLGTDRECAVNPGFAVAFQVWSQVE